MNSFKFDSATLKEIKNLTKSNKLLWKLYKYKQSDVFSSFFYEPTVYNDNREVWFTDFVNKHRKITRLYLFKRIDEKEYTIGVNFLKIPKKLFFIRKLFFNHIELDIEGELFAISETSNLVSSIMDDVKM